MLNLVSLAPLFFQMSQGEEEPKKLQYPLDAKSYKILDEIGRGASAIVYKAICLPISSEVAIKAIDLDQSRADFDRLRLEAKTMSTLSHPNILQAHCCFAVDHHLWVVMPFMSCGSLQSIITSSFVDGLSEQCIAIVLKEILYAISYLHDQGHLHRDIKSGNILVDSNGSVKLADFGVSASIYESNTLSSSSISSTFSTLMLTDIAGTPYWMAPEVIHSHKGYSFKADIWSFGITALELAHGRPPLSHLPPCKSLLMKFTKRFRFSDYEKTSGHKKKFSKSFKDMVGLCLDQDPSKRPSADKLLKHPFFKNCKGPDFLVKNVLQGLPTVERRYLMSKLSRSVSMDQIQEEDEEENPEKNMKQRRISGWNFNFEDFELHPVFPSEQEDRNNVKQVRFCGESTILEEGGNSDTSSTSNSGGQNVAETQMFDDQGCRRGCDDLTRNNFTSTVDYKYKAGSGGDGTVDGEVILNRLLLLKKSLDDESTMVTRMTALILGKKSPEISREEHLMKMVEKLRMELEAERKKTCDLQLELEFIKLHYAIE